MKLVIELVPATAWYANLRNRIPREEWDRIRKQAYADAGYRCAICGAEGKLSCHEIWKYDDKRHIQKLRGFTALCEGCHRIKHLGFANIQASKGLLDMNALIRHFMQVNGVDRQTFEQHRTESFAIWQRRSEHRWKTDLGPWEKRVKYPTDV